MRYQVWSYRNGARVVPAAAFAEVCDVLDAIDIAVVEAERVRLQAAEDARAAAAGVKPRKKGVQPILNAMLRASFGGLPEPWAHEVRLFQEADEESGKGEWTMDFRKEFQGGGIGMEVTFNHAEALAWTPVRLDLAHHADGVRPEAAIDAGIILIAKDSLKQGRMDGADGTFERLLTVLPRVRQYVTVPLLVYGMEWSSEKGDRAPHRIELTTSKAKLKLAGPAEAAQEWF